MAVNGSTVLTVWSHSLLVNNASYRPSDLLMRRSTNGGMTWDPPLDQPTVNLSANAGNSDFPKAAVSGGNIYVVWSDTTPGNFEIFFRRGMISAAGASAFAYISNHLSHTVSVIDIATNNVVATVPVGTNPAGVAVHPDGTRVYVANSGSSDVSVIDAASNTVMATVSVLPSGGPFAVAVNRAGTRLYVTNLGGSTVSVIDTAKIGTAEDPVITTVPLGWLIRMAWRSIHLERASMWPTRACLPSR